VTSGGEIRRRSSERCNGFERCMVVWEASHKEDTNKVKTSVARALFDHSRTASDRDSERSRNESSEYEQDQKRHTGHLSHRSPKRLLVHRRRLRQTIHPDFELLLYSRPIFPRLSQELYLASQVVHRAFSYIGGSNSVTNEQRVWLEGEHEM
jgi:hypothetical protein